MKRILGLGVGVLWLVFTFIAFQRSAEGRAMDAPDIGLWWAIIGVFLGIAALAALGGTLIHTRSRK